VADQPPLHPWLHPSNGWPPFNLRVGNLRPPRSPQLASVSSQRSKPPGGQPWIIWSSCCHMRTPPLRISCWLMHGKRLPFPSTLGIMLLAVQTALLLGRRTAPKMPHVQKQPQIRCLELPIVLLGRPLGACLDPPPRCLVAPCCNLRPLFMVTSPSLSFHKNINSGVQPFEPHLPTSLPPRCLSTRCPSTFCASLLAEWGTHFWGGRLTHSEHFGP
jgi:hypothetical protein